MDIDAMRDLDRSPEWQNVCDMVAVAADSPSREKYAAVGRAAVLWAQAGTGFPRESTSNSASETALYKEEPVETIALDHLGRKVVADADGGYTVEATPDEGLAVDGTDVD